MDTTSRVVAPAAIAAHLQLLFLFCFLGFSWEENQAKEIIKYEKK